MGKINLIISDDVDAKFRAEVFKRKGMKKGNLTEALEEAMTLWVNSDALETIRRKAMSDITVTDMKNLVDALAAYGKVALPALTDLLTKKGLKSQELEHISKAIQRVSPSPPEKIETP